jgi:hypothetical protein
MKRSLLFAALAALALATPAAAQDPWDRQVRDMLVEAGKRLEGDGMALTHPIQTGSLNQGAKRSLSFTLAPGRAYSILGLCDEDCTDVDLALYDASGRQVALDVEDDDFPVVSVAPARTGAYRVEVSMAACSEAPCRYGVGVFAVQGGAVASAAGGQADPWDRQVRDMLVEAGKRLEGNGLSLTHQIQTGSLNEGASRSLSFTLDIGREYSILGLCDEDCTDVDLTLYDAAGRQVASDLEADDYPMVSVTPSRSGTYRVEVKMAACSEAPCRYGVGVFAR